MVQVEAKITSKGQVTIPHAIRQALQMHEGDMVVFELADDGVRLRLHSPKTVQEFVGAGRVGEGKTAAEIVAEVRALRDA